MKKNSKVYVDWKQVHHQRTEVTKRIANCKLSMRQLGKKYGIDYTFISKVLNGKATMSEEMAGRFLTALDDEQA